MPEGQKDQDDPTEHGNTVTNIENRIRCHEKRFMRIIKVVFIYMFRRNILWADFINESTQRSVGMFGKQ